MTQQNAMNRVSGNSTPSRANITRNLRAPNPDNVAALAHALLQSAAVRRGL